MKSEKEAKNSIFHRLCLCGTPAVSPQQTKQVKLIFEPISFQLKLRTPHLYWVWQDKLIFHAIFTSLCKSMMPSIASAASLAPLLKQQTLIYHFAINFVMNYFTKRDEIMTYSKDQP